MVAQMIKNSPAMQETQIPSLGWEDPLEKGMAAHSSILAWRIPWTEELGKLQSQGCKDSDTNEQLNNSNKLSVRRHRPKVTRGIFFLDQVVIRGRSLAHRSSVPQHSFKFYCHLIYQKTLCLFYRNT